MFSFFPSTILLHSIEVKNLVYSRHIKKIKWSIYRINTKKIKVGKISINGEMNDNEKVAN